MNELTKDQKNAYELMSSGENVFLTGKAGTGKSYLINEFINTNSNKNILITAPTGIAAIEIGGSTLHRTFKIPVKDIHNVSRGPKYVNNVLDEGDILIIDEISMCRLDVFDYVMKSIKLANAKRGSNRRPYQMILVGDFLQLPPILGRDESLTYRQIYGHQEVFPFYSSLWSQNRFNTIELKDVVRQEGDNLLIDNLNLARRGDRRCLQYFNNFVVPPNQYDKDAIFICPTNKKAKTVNDAKIDMLSGRGKTYDAKISGEVLKSDKPTDDSLFLKVGARIMTLVNNPSEGYVNGSMGTCVELGNDFIKVEIDKTGDVVTINPYTWEVNKYDVEKSLLEEDGKAKLVNKPKLKKIGEFEQLPIKVAFAITTHKSQGQTFDKVVIDPYAWDSGQLYVSLSRVKSSRGLQLTSYIRPNYLLANQGVVKFYDSSAR